MKQYEVTMAGFGGQGMMVAGQLLAYSGIKEGKNVVWIPSYGPEMRGGTAYCTVVISDVRIGSPIINNPTACCVFNRPSFDKFAPQSQAGRIADSQFVADQRRAPTGPTSPRSWSRPTRWRSRAASVRSTNVVVLGCFVAATGMVEYKTMLESTRRETGHEEGAA